jgi:ADP-ribose pyrophosphatase YjhB (NUDIX family)
VIVQNENGSVLLGRRAKESTYSGLWCIPCGYVEYDEEVRAAARREFFEETGLEVELGEVFAVLSNFHNPETHTVGIWFGAEITGGTIQAGDDLDAVEWFSIDKPPSLAFPTDYAVLEMLSRRISEPCRRGQIGV